VTEESNGSFFGLHMQCNGIAAGSEVPQLHLVPSLLVHTYFLLSILHAVLVEGGRKSECDHLLYPIALDKAACQLCKHGPILSITDKTGSL
jgi:hypothetical protein